MSDDFNGFNAPLSDEEKRVLGRYLSDHELQSEELSESDRDLIDAAWLKHASAKPTSQGAATTASELKARTVKS